MKSLHFPVPSKVAAPRPLNRSCSCGLSRNLTVRWALGQPGSLFQKSGAELRGCNLLECLPARLRARLRKAAERAFSGVPATMRMGGLGIGAGGNYSVTLFRIPRGRWGEELALVAQPAPQASPVPVIAQFLHDEVGPLLSAAGLELDLLRLDLTSAAPEAVDRIDRVQASLEGVMERVRELTRELQAQSKSLPLRKEADALYCPPS